MVVGSRESKDSHWCDDVRMLPKRVPKIFILVHQYLEDRQGYNTCGTVTDLLIPSNHKLVCGQKSFT